ncbi:uncharacterized protein [Panulirus ornatus]|uniref:uncharacterized protein n=1 Tax=Panulirus ornatus TaxID=150431 RepID=UPI003A8C3F01
MRSVGPVAVLVALVIAPFSSPEFVLKSILCDDIEAICEENDLSYTTNKTACRENQQQFLSPTICNCGTMCIDNLEEGESCNTASLVSYPSQLCGPGLECIPENHNKPETSVCTRNPARQCIGESLQYEADQDAGTLGPGRYKPRCDQYGRYSASQCSPGSTCYCVNAEGERLFGEGPITDQDKIDCQCSSYWEETKSKGLNFGLRCLPNGNFDPLQCFDGICFCYDYATNSLTYGPFSSAMLTDIACYDPEIHNKDYINPCHKDQEKWDSQGGNDTIIVGGTSRPICNPDGYYAAVQYLGPNATCTDIYGNLIESFALPIYQATNMNCNCARRRHIMEENGLGASKPKCCDDGGYYPWQTRGLLSFCVDDNGNQYGNEVAATDITSLDCYSTTPCKPLTL